MLTDRETDSRVSTLASQATIHAWPDHVAENFRTWLQRGAVVVHVGREVIAVRTWTGAILREFREQGSADGMRRANEEFYGLEGEPVVDEQARLIAQTGDGSDGVETSVISECPRHGKEREIGCMECGFPVIERIGPCGCPLPRPWINDERGWHPNYRAITGQIDHATWCPGYESKRAVVVEPQMAPTEIVRPKRAKVKVESLTLGGVK